MNKNYLLILIAFCFTSFGSLAQPLISYNPTSFNETINSCDDSVSVTLTIYNTGSADLDFEVLDGIYGPIAEFGFAYITNVDDNTVSVLDVTTNTLVGVPIPVGSFPWRATIRPDGKYVYVSNRDGSSISVIRTSDNTVTATIPVGNGPSGLAFTPDGNFAYVGNRWDNNVMVIDIATNTVINTIADVSIPLDTISGPQDIVITPDGQYAYVANAGSGITVIEIGPDTVAATIPTSWLYDNSMVITPDGQYIYVSRSWGSDDVIVISTATNTIVATIGGFDRPHSLDITPDGKYIYVADGRNLEVDIIEVSTNTVINTISDPIFTGGGAWTVWGMAISPDGNYAYVTLTWSTPTVVIIDINTNTVVGSEILPGNRSNGIATLNVGVPWLAQTPLTGTIVPGDSAIIDVTFYSARLNVGTYDANIYISSNDPSSPMDTIPVTLTVTGSPVLDVSLSCIDLDTVGISGTNTNSVTVINNGCDTLIVNSITTSTAEFSSDSSSLKIAPYSSATVVVSFSPTSTGSFLDTLQLLSNDIDTAICLFGFAIPSAQASFNPDSINVLITSCNDSVGVPVTIYNTGTVALNYGISTVTDAPPFNFAYIANGNNNTVSVIDITTNTLITQVAVGARPWRVSLKPDSKYAYSSNGIRWSTPGNSVTVIRTSDNVVTATIPVGIAPTGLAFTPDGNFAYVGNRGSDNVMKIDCNTNTVVNTITGALTQPMDIAITPDGQYAYVATKGSGVAVIDIAADVVIATVSGISSAQSIIITPDGAFAYVSQGNRGSVVYVIDLSTNTVVTSISGFDGPHELDITRDGSMVWVADYWDNEIVGIDVSTNTVVSTITDNVRLDDAWGLALSYDGNLAYVTRGSNSIDLLVVDLNTGTILTDFDFPGTSSYGVATSKNGLPWMDASPNAGTVLPGDSTVVTINVNGLGVNSGTYTGNIIISSNDPNSPQYIPVTFTIDGVPDIDISANCLALDTTMITATSTSPLWFYNNGCDTLFVTGITNSTPEFGADTNQMAIPPYDSMLLTASFSPTTTGLFLDTFIITTNDVDTTVCLSGFAIPAPIISTNPDSLSATVTGCCDSITVPITIYNTGGGDLIYTPVSGTYNSTQSFTYSVSGALTNFTFTNFILTDSIYVTITLNGDFNSGSEYAELYMDGDYIGIIPDGNPSNGTNIVVTYMFTDAQLAGWLADGQIIVTLDNQSNVGLAGTNLHQVQIVVNAPAWLSYSTATDTIAPGDSAILDVSFNSCGQLAGTYNDFFFISSNDPQVPLNSIPVSFTIIGFPEIALSDTCLDLGTIMEFTTSSTTFDITNNGCDTLFVTDSDNSLTEFSLSDTSYFLLPGASLTVTVTFAPLNSGTYTDTIIIFNNDIDTSICLTGVALESPTLSTNPDSFNVTINSCCDSAFFPLTIYNTGAVDLTVDVTATGVGSSIFYDGFESGNISTWVNEFGAYTKQVASGSAANGNFNVEFPGSLTNHLDGISHTFTPSTPDRISWYMKSSSTSQYGGFVVIGNNPTGSASGIIYMFMRSTASFYLNNRVLGAYVANQWYYIELRNIDFITKTYDFYIDGVLLAGNEPFKNAALNSINEVHLYGWGSSDVSSFDDIAIGEPPTDWLSTSIGLDTIAPGDSTVVNVGFNSCGLNSGTYSGDIIISSNDPQNSPDTISLTFTIDGTPTLDISDTCLNFDTIMEFTTATDSFTIYNYGCDTLFITDAGNNLAAYTLSDTSGFLLPGDSLIITVVFSPLNSGIYADTITLFTNDGDTTICLMGVALESPTISTNPDSIDVTISGCCDSTIVPITVYNTGAADLIYSAATGGYDSTILINYTISGALTDHIFTNMGGGGDSIYLTIMLNGDYNASFEFADMYIDGGFIAQLNPTISCSDVYFNFAFGGSQVATWLSDGIITVTLDNSSGVGLSCSNAHQVQLIMPIPIWVIVPVGTDTIAPGDSSIINVIFTSCGSNTGVYSDNIYFLSNDPLQPIDTLPVTFEVIGEPIISLSDTCLYLDSIIEFTTFQNSFMIYNTGCDTLFITDANNNLAEYTLSDTATVILPGDSASITVTFAPLSAGLFQDTVTILNNDTVITLCLYGYGILRPSISFSGDSIDVTIASCCDSMMFPLTIYNTGGSDLYFNIPLCNNTSLDTVLSRINQNFTMVNNAIPSRYDFSDGISGTNISDGGNDMYDGGNYLNTNFGTSIPYSDNAIVSDARVGATGRYFTRKYPGLFVFAADIDAVTYFELTGNLGADGSGSADATILNTVSCGSNYTGFVKRVFGTSNPSVNHLIIVEDNPSLSQTWTTNTDSDQHRVLNLDALPNTRLYYLLYASASGGYIDDAQTQNIMDQFLNAILQGTRWDVTPTADTIAPNDSTIVTVNFKSCGLIAGTYSGDILIYSNDPITPVDTVPATLTLNGPPQITLSDTCLYLDSIMEFTTFQNSFTIRNDGCDTLFVSDLNNTLPEFTFSDTSATLLPGDSLIVTVTFAPVTTGFFEDTIQIINNDTASSVCLSGYGFPRPIMSSVPDSIDVLIVGCCDSLTVPITIYNTGGNDLIYDIDTSGYYLALDGSGDYVSIPYDNSLDLISSLTIECWMYINSMTGVWQGLIGKATGFPGRNYAMWLNNANYIHFTYDNVSTTQVAVNSAPGSVNLGQWHHVACVLDVGGGIMQTYIDGNLAASGSPNGTPMSGAGSFNMGRNPAGSANSYINGRLDEVRVWNYAKTQAQIQLGMNQRANGNEAGLVSYWNFNDQTPNDLTLNMNNGVFGGNAFAAPGSPFQVQVFELSIVMDTIVPGDSSIVDVVFISCDKNSGVYTSSVVINSNDPLSAFTTIPVTFEVQGAPEVVLSDTCLNFDTIFQFTTDTDSLYIRNDGCDTLFVTGITTSSAEFTPDSTTFIILPGDSSLVQVTFAPLGVGAYSETLTVFNNDADTTICLTGFALSPPIISYVPDTVNVVITTCNDTMNVPLTVYNTGTEDLIFTGEFSLGYSMSVDGIDDYIPLGNPAELQITGDMTIEMWVMPSNFSARRNPYAKAFGGEGTITQETNATLNYYYGISGANAPPYTLLNSLTPLTAGIWNHIAIVRDLTNMQLYWYINGVQTNTGAAPWASASASTLPALIAQGYVSNYAGNMDEIRIWNVAKSQLEIQQSMGKRANGFEPGLVGYWNFDDLTATDLSPSSNPGTFTNGAFAALPNAPVLPSWLSSSPSGDTVVSGDSTLIIMQFTSTGLITGTYSDIYVINSNDPLSPVDTIPVTLTVQGYPIVTVSDTCLNFDTIFQFTSDLDNFYIGNTGCDTLFVTNIVSSSAEITVDTTTLTILPGDSALVIATFSPLSPGAYSETLTIFNNDMDTTICLIGFALSPPIISYDPDTINVTISACNDTVSYPFVITNLGTSDLIYDIYNMNYGNGMFTADYYYSPGTGGSPVFGPFIFSAQEQYINQNWGGGGPGNGIGNDDYQVRWTANIYAETNGTYNFRSNSDDGIRLYIDGTLVIDYWLDQGATNRFGAIVLTTGLHDLVFEYYENGGGANASLFWTPPAQAEQLIPASTFNGIWLIPFTDTLLTGDTTIANVMFSSTGLITGTYTDTIIITSNDPLSPIDTIPVILTILGNPVISVSDTCLNFDTIFQFTSTQDSLYIRNDGCDTLFVTNIVSSSAEITVDTTNFTLLPGDSGLVTATFSPLSPGAYAETLTIFNNDMDTTICLTGFALSPPIISYDPDTFNVTITTCDDSVTLSLTVYNTGTEDLIFNLNKQGYSTSLDGATGHVDCGNNAIFQIPQGTIEAWFNTNTTSTQFAAGIPYDDGVSWNNPWVGFQIGTSSNQGRFWFNVNGVDVEFTAGTISTGVWHHVALTYDGSIARGFIDGVQVGTQNVAGSITYLGSPSFVIGNRSVQAPGERFNGKVDEVRFWNFARSQAEIQSTMNLLLNGNEPGLIGYWNFDDQTATDLTANGNDGIFSGSATTTVPNAPVSNWLSFSQTPDTVVSSDSSVMNVQFNSTGLITGTYTTDIIITSNDPLSPVDTIPATLTVQGYPIISTSDTCLDFDTILQFTSTTRQFTVYNTGCDTLFVDSIINSLGVYTVDTGLFTLPVGDSILVTATFSPLALGTFTDTFNIFSNDSLLQICLIGEAVPPPIISSIPDTIKLIITTCTDSVTTPLNIYNTGVFNLIYTIDTTGGHMYDLSLIADTVLFNDSSTISVLFDASGLTPGTYNDSIAITSNDPLIPLLVVPTILTITSLPAAPSANDTAICFGDPSPTFVATGDTGINGDTIHWYSDLALTTVLDTGNNFTPTDVAVGSYTYYLAYMIDSCNSLPDSVVFTINNGPNPLVANDTGSCFLDPVPDLSSTPGTFILWYDDAGLTNQVFTGQVFPTGETAAGGYTYYVVDSVDGCPASVSDTVTLTISALPPLPVASDTSTCEGDTVPDLIAVGANIIWYTDPGLSSVLFSGDTLVTGETAPGTYTYYVSQNPTGCESLGDTVTLTIYATPLPVASDTSSCFGFATPDLIATGNAVQWYSDSLLDTLIIANDTLITGETAVGVYTYYVTQTDSLTLCESFARTIVLTIYPIPAMPITADTTECYLQPVPPLTATGTSIQWYSDIALTVLEASGSPFATGDTAIGSYPYYVTQTVSGCESPADTATLNIIPIPLAPTTTDQMICFGDATPDLIAGGANIKWYDDAGLTSLVFTGDTFVPADTAVGVYLFYATDSVAGCEGPSSTVIFTISPLPVVPVVADSTVCFGTPAPDFVVSGTFVEWYDDSLLTNIVQMGDTFQSPETAVGSYTYYVADSTAACARGTVDTVVFTINAIPGLPTVSDTSICLGDSVPSLIASGVGLQWYSDPALTVLVFTGDTFASGDIAIGTYNYYVTQFVGGCEGQADTATLTINFTPAPAASDITICFGDPVPDLVATGGAITWYSDLLLDTLVFTGSSFASGDTAIGVYIYFARDSANGCFGPAILVTLTINLGLTAPPTATDVTSCYGLTPADLVATGLYLQWYTDTGLTNLVFTGDSFAAPDTAVGSYNYYVTDSVAGCPEGMPDTATLTIITLPASPVAADTGMCFGTPTAGLIATGLGLIQWYSDAGLTTLVGTGDTLFPADSTVGSYDYYATDSLGGCEGTADMATLTIVGIPATPTSPDITICVGDSTPDLIASGANIEWYSDSALTTLVFAGDTFIPADTLVGVYDYYVVDADTATGCNSFAATVLFTIDGASQLDISDLCFDFDSVIETTSASDTLFFYNAGCDTLIITSATTTLSEYTVDTTGVAILPGDTGMMIITFSPLSAGPYLDTLVITSNANDTAVCLSGVGLGAPVISNSPDSFNLSFTGCCDSTTLLMTIYNTGASNLIYAIASDSSWVTFSVPGGIIAPSDSEIVDISFDGCTINPGNYTANIFINSNDPASSLDTSFVTLVKDTLPAPPISGDVAVCYGDSVLPFIASSPDDSILWYSDAALTLQVFAGDTFFSGNTAVGVYVYYNTAWRDSCEGPSDSIRLDISALPVAQSVADASQCFGYQTPALVASGTLVSWYDDTLMTNLVFVGDSFVSADTAIGLYTYFLNDSTPGCTTGPVDTVTLSIDPTPPAPAASDTTICLGDSVPSLTATGVNLQWYSDTALTVLEFSGDTFSTGATLVGIYTYFVTQTDTAVNTCESFPDTVVLTINGIPAAPSVGDTTICIGNPIPVFVASGTNIKWFDDAALTNLLFTGDSFVTTDTVPGIYTYYLTDSVTACAQSEADTVVFTINSLTAVPTATDTSICYGTPTPDLVALGSNIQWYDDSLLTNLVFSGDSFAAPATAVGTYIYFVTDSSVGCPASPPDTSILEIKTTPSAPITSDTTICFGDVTPDLIAVGATVMWYDDFNLTSLVYTGNTFTSNDSTVGPHIYYVTQIDSAVNTCESPASMVTLTINAIPPAPAMADATECEGQPIPVLVATGSSIEWYSDTSLTTNVGSGVAFMPMDSMAGTYVYYATQTVLGCESPLDSATLTIMPTPPAPIGFSNVACETGPVPGLKAIGTNLTWYSDINLTNQVGTGSTYMTGQTTAGVYDYYVTDSLPGCVGPYTVVTLTIDVVPTAPAGVDQTICAGDSIPTLTAGGTGITWYSDPTLIVAIETGNTLSPKGVSTAGTYNYYVTQSNAGCGEGPADTVTLTINPTPLVTLNTYSVIIPLGDSANLIAYNASTYSWSPATNLNTTVGSSVYASPTIATLYTVTGTNSFGCSSDTSVWVLVDNGTTIDEVDVIRNLTVYPNPSQGNFLVIFKSYTKDPIEIRIVDAIGELVHTREAKTSNGTYREEFVMTEMATGVYYIQIITDKAMINKKIVVLQDY